MNILIFVQAEWVGVLKKLFNQVKMANLWDNRLHGSVRFCTFV